MNGFIYREKIKSFDSRRNLVIPGDLSATIDFSVEYILFAGQEAIQKNGFFTPVLSGGSTPKAILQKLVEPKNAARIDREKTFFFFGDERSVPPNHPDSNYGMAMQTALIPLHIPENRIFRMIAETDSEKNAAAYEAVLREKARDAQPDLIMLGLGEDGHTASLFPGTQALKEESRLVVVNEVPQKNTHRMTLTYPAIRRAEHVCFFVFGKSKSKIVADVLQGLYQPETYPSQKVGTEERKALWILDREAAQHLSL